MYYIYMYIYPGYIKLPGARILHGGRRMRSLQGGASIFARAGTNASSRKFKSSPNYPGKRLQTVWGSGRITYDNVVDGDDDDMMMI